MATIDVIRIYSRLEDEIRVVFPPRLMRTFKETFITLMLFKHDKLNLVANEKGDSPDLQIFSS